MYDKIPGVVDSLSRHRAMSRLRTKSNLIRGAVKVQAKLFDKCEKRGPHQDPVVVQVAMGYIVYEIIHI
jgi:hypothetical protein